MSRATSVLLDILAAFGGFILALLAFLPVCSALCNGDCVEHCWTWWGLPLPDKWFDPPLLIIGAGAASGVLLRRWIAARLG